MKNFTSVATNHPFRFVFGLMIVWFLFVIVFTGLASSALRKPYGDAITATIGRLVVTICLLLLVWRLGRLKASGITRLGPWLVWLFALGGMIYFASASLYSFYDKLAFDFPGLIRLPAARTTVLMHFVAGLSEEILFRGVLLYALIRVWGHTKQGMIGCVLLTSLLFAVVHITQVFTHRVTLSAALLLTLETWIISI